MLCVHLQNIYKIFSVTDMRAINVILCVAVALMISTVIILQIETDMFDVRGQRGGSGHSYALRSLIGELLEMLCIRDYACYRYLLHRVLNVFVHVIWWALIIMFLDWHIDA